MKISDYLPNLYKNNKEMYNIIYSEEQEFENNLKKDIEDRFSDGFAKIATEKGIQQFETILHIQSDEILESLDFRRKRVITRLNSKIPFTETFLINQLNDILGKGTWAYEIDYNEYTLDIYSLVPGNLWYRELIDFLTKTIPCNINWTVTVYSSNWNQVLDKFKTWNNITSMTWQDIMDGEWV